MRKSVAGRCSVKIDSKKPVPESLFLNLRTLALKVFREFSSWASKNAASAFFDTKQNHVCWKFWKVSKFFGCIARVYFFIMLRGLRFVQWVRFFERNCIVKRVTFFASFYWVWDFLLENLKWKDKLQTWGFESFIFWSKCCFWGLF